MSTATTTKPPAPTPQLRPPFKLVAHVSSKIAGTVNGAIDGTLNILGKSTNAFLSNSLIVSATKSIRRLEANVQGKVRPYTAKTQPYVQPLVPYMNKAKPYIPPVIVAFIALASIPVFFTALVVAFFTAPIWLTVGFFTAFIWIPIAFFAFLSSVFIAFIAAVRYFSLPTGQAFLQRWWVAISSTPSGRKIFFVTAKPVPAITK